jgi:hypothetical protein
MQNKAPETSDLSILTTEHFTLQSGRQLCLQDMQGRSTMFLTAVSASLIAIGFFGTATHFGGGFVVFVLALLASLWVLGFFTFVRIIQAAVEDVIICFGIARIRHRYVEIAPNLSDSFVRSIHDDFRRPPLQRLQSMPLGFESSQAGFGVASAVASLHGILRLQISS